MTRAWVVGAGSFLVRPQSEEARASGLAPGLSPLPSVASAFERVTHALARLDGVSLHRPLLDPTYAVAVAEWKRLRDEANGQATVVHFIGHGIPEGRNLYLAVIDSDVARLPRTALKVSELLDEIEDTRGAGPALLFLDVCSAGRAVSAQIEAALSADRRAWIIAACADGQTTSRARFSQATAAVLERLAKGWLDVSPALRYVPVEVLAQEIDRELARAATRDGGTYGQTVVRTPRLEASAETPPFFSNPAYTENATGKYRARSDAALWQFAAEMDPGLDPVHFITRAAGVMPHGGWSGGCLFAGRQQERVRVKNWLENLDEPNLLVVTGSPGCGKSALLGLAACMTHADLADVADSVLRRFPPAERPRPQAKVLAVHARRRTTAQVAASLACQLTGIYQAGRVDEIVELLKSAGPLVVMVDALDEAAEPEHLLDALLLPLVGATGEGPHSGCRVMIGTRPWWDRFPGLYRAARDPRCLLDLDEVPGERVEADLADYLTELFWRDPLYGPAAARQIAAAAAQARDHGGFLLAAIYADYLLHLSPRLPAEEAASRVPRTIAEMLDVHLDSLDQGNAWIRPVLRALSCARGQGMPADLVHLIASSLSNADQPAGALAATMQDTLDVLADVAFYLQTSQETDGRLLYRFFHESLSDHLADETQADQRAALSALLDDVARTPDGKRDWALAHPYVLRHAASYAADASADLVDQLVTEGEFLVHADPAALAPALDRANSQQARLAAVVYRTSLGIHRHLSSGARRRVLALDAAAYQVKPLARELNQRLPETVLRPHWSTGRGLNSALRESVPAARYRSAAALACTQVAGRPVVAIGGWEGCLNVWDLTTGSFTGSPVSGHDETVMCIACVESDGRCMAVTCGLDGRVQVWDLTTGRNLGQLAVPYQAGGHLVACTPVNGVPVAVIGEGDGALRLWDLRSREPIGPPFGEHRGIVTSLAPFSLNEIPMVVTGDSTGTLRRWNLVAAELWEDPLSCTRQDDVLTLACLQDDGRPVCIAGIGRTVEIWDLSAGQRSALIEEHSDAVYATACTRVDDVPVAVTGSRDMTARIWDLRTGLRIGPPLRHTDDVVSAACGAVGDSAVAVTSGRHGEMKVWNLSGLADIRDVSLDELSTVKGLACSQFTGRPVVVSGAFDGAILIHELDSGNQIGHLTPERWRGDDLACVDIDGVPAVVYTGRDNTIAGWRLEDGYPPIQIHFPSLDETIDKLLCCLEFSGSPYAVARIRYDDFLVLDLDTRNVRRIRTHGASITTAAFAMLGSIPAIVTGSSDGKVRIWDLQEDRQIGPALMGHSGEVKAVSCATVAGVPVAVTGGADKIVRAWDLASHQALGQPMERHGAEVNAIACTEVNGKTLAFSAGEDGSMLTWDLQRSQCVDEWPVLRGVPAMTTSPAGYLIVALGSNLATFTLPSMFANDVNDLYLALIVFGYK